MALSIINPQEEKPKSNKLGLALEALGLGLKGVDTAFDIKGLMSGNKKPEETSGSAFVNRMLNKR